MREIRRVERDGQVWFMAADICNEVGITNCTVAMRTIAVEHKRKIPFGGKGMSEKQFLNEAGVHELLGRTKKPGADAFDKQFTEWVAGGMVEVEPGAVKQGIGVDGWGGKTTSHATELPNETENAEDEVKMKVSNAGAMSVFENAEFGDIRILRDGEKYMFCARDVAKALGYKDTVNAIRVHCRWVAKYNLPHPQSPNKELEMAFIPEGDVYRLIASSKMEAAEEFEHWLFDEMLPTTVKSAKALESIEYCGEIEGLVYTKNGIPMTTSEMISKKFQKNHRDILRMIDNKMTSVDKSIAQFCAEHIHESQYIIEDGRTFRQYELDKQGFSFIVLSMTGVQADVFKIQYINAFTKMEEKIAEMYKARVLESVLPQNNSNRQFVYIIKNPLNDTVKIGVAQDVQKRLQQLQTGAGVELELLYQSVVCSNAYSIESDVHSHFADYRTFGEWYKVPVNEAIDYLERQRFVLRSEYAKYISLVPKCKNKSVG